MQKTLLTTKEVSRLLRISPSTIDKYRKRGLIPFIRLPSGKIRFDQEEIIRWIEERRVSTI